MVEELGSQGRNEKDQARGQSKKKEKREKRMK